MKKLLVVLAVALSLAVTGIGFASAQNEQPITVSPSYALVDDEGEHVLWVWEIDGKTITETGEIFGCCGESCVTDYALPEIVGQTNLTNVPELTPTTQPDPTPTATPEPDPTPVEEEENCNRGIGNGSEGCDPGNSYGQGNGNGRRAGEDRGE